MGGSYYFMTHSFAILNALSWSSIHSLAFLYTDPGSGALVWQLLVASFVGGLFYIRSFIRKIAAMMFGGRSGERRDQQAAVDQAGSTTPNQNRLP
jgi:hypothetical protein